MWLLGGWDAVSSPAWHCLRRVTTVCLSVGYTLTLREKLNRCGLGSEDTLDDHRGCLKCEKRCVFRIDVCFTGNGSCCRVLVRIGVADVRSTRVANTSVTDECNKNQTQ